MRTLVALLCLLCLAFPRLVGALDLDGSENGISVKNKSLGSFRILVLLVQFSDHADRQLPPRSHFEDLCNNEIGPYLTRQSYGHLTVTGCDVHEWTTVAHDEAYYAGEVMGKKPTGETAELFEPLLDQLDNDGANWADYDSDGNGKLDILLVIHSGFAAEQGRGKRCNAPPVANRIVSQGHMGQDNGWMNADGTIELSGFALASAYRGVCNENKWASMSVATHEIIHTFRIPDLYDVGNWEHPKLGGIGVFDCMSNAVGPKADGQCGELSAFTKVEAKWAKPIEIENDGTYTARNSNRFPDVFRINLFESDEYLLIENRQQVDYDSSMPGGGILIFHVDESVKSQKNPGFPGQEGWPTNGNHYRVALLPADGLYDLEQYVNNGDAGDYWVKNQSIGPSKGDDIYPNTDSYKDGIIKSTGIRITILSDPGAEMSFQVGGLGGGDATSSPTSTPTSNSGGATIIHWSTTSDPVASDPVASGGIDPSFFMSASLTKNVPTSAPTAFSKPTTRLEVDDLKPTLAPTAFNKPTTRLEMSDMRASGTVSSTQNKVGTGYKGTTAESSAATTQRVVTLILMTSLLIRW